MYVYTDDDLTRINRDYLGPKGKRLPWVMTYRAYGVVLGAAFFMFGVFWVFQIPFNKWTALLFVFVVAMIVTFITRRMRRDVSLWAMFRAGWQEVVAPRPPAAKQDRHRIVSTVPLYPYDTPPRPRWWMLRARMQARSGRSAAATPTQRSPLTQAPPRPTSRSGRRNERVAPNRRARH